MSQDETPDLATPQAGKIAPEAVALRAQPRPVTRLNRRTLAILAGTLSVAVLGALMWSLQPQRRGAGEQGRQDGRDGLADGRDHGLLTENLLLAAAILQRAPPRIVKYGRNDNSNEETS